MVNNLNLQVVNRAAEQFARPQDFSKALKLAFGTGKLRVPRVTGRWDEEADESKANYLFQLAVLAYGGTFQGRKFRPNVKLQQALEKLARGDISSQVATTAILQSPKSNTNKSTKSPPKKPKSPKSRSRSRSRSRSTKSRSRSRSRSRSTKSRSRSAPEVGGVPDQIPPAQRLALRTLSSSQLSKPDLLEFFAIVHRTKPQEKYKDMSLKALRDEADKHMQKASAVQLQDTAKFLSDGGQLDPKYVRLVERHVALRERQFSVIASGIEETKKALEKKSKDKKIPATKKKMFEDCLGSFRALEKRLKDLGYQKPQVGGGAIRSSVKKSSKGDIAAGVGGAAAGLAGLGLIGLGAKSYLDSNKKDKSPPPPVSPLASPLASPPASPPASPLASPPASPLPSSTSSSGTSSFSSSSESSTPKKKKKKGLLGRLFG